MKHYDIVIVGAGPAGMAAARAAFKSTSSILVVDDNQTPGGQIWRGAELAIAADFLPGARVIDGNSAEQQLTVETSSVFQLSYSKLILCTGARELFLPFPGWTLPNVFGVGGLQAIAKSGLSVQGKRVVVAGSGPLLLAVAAYLQEHGATVPVIAEQAGWNSLAKFSLALLQHPDKLKQALEIKKSLLGTRYLPNCWVIKASGNSQVEQVTLLHEGRQVEERCDYLAVGYGFVPNTELAQLLGCELAGSFVAVDKRQQTSIPGIYCAGEPTGLGGVDESVLEGEIAGYAATASFPRISRRQTTHFSQILESAFRLRSELFQPSAPDTIICRCEDVPLGRLQTANSWHEAKLHFRCGMGPCQGRICGPIVQHYFGWTQKSVRPPIFPTKLENLIVIKETTHL